MDFIAVPVPPPKSAPVHQIAETLGLLPGLRAKRNERSFRCGNCQGFNKEQSWMVWVPDGVRMQDSADDVVEQARSIAYNGESSGWCLKCALKLGKKIAPQKPEYTVPQSMPPQSWWRRWFGL